MTLLPGEPVPKFTLPGTSSPRFTFDSAAGRYLLVIFAKAQRVETIRATLISRSELFNDAHASAFLVVVGEDPDRASRIDSLPGVRLLFDTDESVARAYAANEQERWHLIDPALHLLSTVGSEQAHSIFETIAALPAPAVHGGFVGFAPVLVTPRIFEPDFCRVLMDLYHRVGGEPSGVMRQLDGKTRLVMSPDFKRRSDVIVDDTTLKKAIAARLERRLAPQIEKVFGFRPTRIERYLIGRYDAETGGFFRPHRDNTTPATQHRRFAVSINLNDGYEGGDLRFPEFGSRTYRPPPGGACVFSCSILHEVTEIGRGERFAFLPFLHDEAAETVRAANQGALAS